MTKVHTYPSDDLIVEYDAARCIHVKECVKGLPTVFDPNRRSWVDPRLVSAEEVEDVIRRCPTGALHYRRKTGESETPAPTNEVRTVADGPLYIQGRIDLKQASGETTPETRGWKRESCQPRRGTGTRGMGTFRPSRVGSGRRRCALCIGLPLRHRVSCRACGCEWAWTRCCISKREASRADGAASHSSGTDWSDAGSQSSGSTGT